MSKPTWTDVWYDWNIRLWCVQVKDENGHQYEDCSEYCNSKPSADETDQYYRELYSIDLKYSRKRRREYKQNLKDGNT